MIWLWIHLTVCELWHRCYKHYKVFKRYGAKSIEEVQELDYWVFEQLLQFHKEIFSISLKYWSLIIVNSQ